MYVTHRLLGHLFLRITLVLALGLFLVPVNSAALDDEAPSLNEETVDAAPDPIKEALLVFFEGVKGRYGDSTVLVCAVLMAAAFWKKMYRAGIGMLVLLVGVVLLRIAILALFG